MTVRETVSFQVRLACLLTCRHVYLTLPTVRCQWIGTLPPCRLTESGFNTRLGHYRREEVSTNKASAGGRSPPDGPSPREDFSQDSTGGLLAQVVARGFQASGVTGID